MRTPGEAKELVTQAYSLRDEFHELSRTADPASIPQARAVRSRFEAVADRLRILYGRKVSLHKEDEDQNGNHEK